MSGEPYLAATRALVLERVRGDTAFVVATHENPDGDALGSLIGMQGALAALGKDCLMFIDSSELPLPQEYRFLSLSGLVSSPHCPILMSLVVSTALHKLPSIVTPADTVRDWISRPRE